MTWSYASALTAFSARRGTVPASWGANGLVVPPTCSANLGPTVQVTFNVAATTQFGGAYPFLKFYSNVVLICKILLKKEDVYLTGSIDALENWSPDKALPLSYTADSLWTSKYSHTVSNVVVLTIFSLSHR